MIEIMEKISDANENFKENIYLKKFNKKYWINRRKRRRWWWRRRRKKENDLDEKKEGPKENSKDKKNNLDQDYVYFIKGDALLE